MKKVRDINIDGSRFAFWKDPDDDLTIVEHTEENDRKFKDSMIRDTRNSFLYAAAMLIIGFLNVLGVYFMVFYPATKNTFGLFELFVTLAASLFFIGEIMFIMEKGIPDVGTVFKNFFNSLFKNKRKLMYAKHYRNDDLMCFVRDIYEKKSENLINEYIQEFNDDDLVEFMNNVKEQLELHKRISITEQLIIESKADAVILEDLKIKAEEMNVRYEELKEEINSFINLAVDFKNKAVQRAANDKAMSVLAS